MTVTDLLTQLDLLHLVLLPISKHQGIFLHYTAVFHLQINLVLSLTQGNCIKLREHKQKLSLHGIYWNKAYTIVSFMIFVYLSFVIVNCPLISLIVTEPHTISLTLAPFIIFPPSSSSFLLVLLSSRGLHPFFFQCQRLTRAPSNWERLLRLKLLLCVIHRAVWSKTQQDVFFYCNTSAIRNSCRWQSAKIKIVVSLSSMCTVQH